MRLICLDFKDATHHHQANPKCHQILQNELIWHPTVLLVPGVLINDVSVVRNEITPIAPPINPIHTKPFMPFGRVS